VIKFISRGADGKQSLWLGLSQQNLDRLPTDPIMVLLSELDDPHIDRVVLVAGTTEKTLTDQLRAMGLPVPHIEEPQPGERREWRHDA
jgi:hypothetical protein